MSIRETISVEGKIQGTVELEPGKRLFCTSPASDGRPAYKVFVDVKSDRSIYV